MHSQGPVRRGHSTGPGTGQLPGEGHAPPAAARTAAAASVIPEGPGVFYRFHLTTAPLDEARARSRPLERTGSPADVPGLRGYSAFASPHHLSQYMDEYSWIGDTGVGWGRREVLAFHGVIAGRGEDNEHLVIPRPAAACCGNVVHSRMPWREFEDRIWNPPPDRIPPKPWASRPWDEDCPVRKSVDRHRRRQARSSAARP